MQNASQESEVPLTDPGAEKENLRSLQQNYITAELSLGSSCCKIQTSKMILSRQGERSLEQLLWGWRGSAGGKALAYTCEGLRLDAQSPHQTLGVAAHTCNSSTSSMAS